MSLMIEVAPGELIDKITILRIKAAMIADPAKLAHVAAELEALERAANTLPDPPGLAALTADLLAVNRALWDIEDDIRRHESAGDFGASFIDLARRVYKTNDRRAALKAAINQQLGARFAEQKSYAA